MRRGLAGEIEGSGRMSAEDRIAELTARVVALEAALKSGGAATEAVEIKDEDYPFIAKLSGDDLIQAQALIAENAQLHKQIDELKDTIAQKDFRIKHLKEGLDKYFK